MKKALSVFAVLAVSVALAGCADAGPPGMPPSQNATAGSTSSFEDLVQVAADCEYIVDLMGGTPAMTAENAPAIKARFTEMADSPHPELANTAEVLIDSANGKQIDPERNSQVFADLKPFCLDKLGEAEGQVDQ